MASVLGSPRHSAASLLQPPGLHPTAFWGRTGCIPQFWGKIYSIPHFLGGQDLLQPGAGARKAPGERFGEKQFLRMLDIIKC